MGCDTCKSECGRQDGCGTRKATQKELLDGLIGRLYPSRRWGEPDDQACFRAGLHAGQVTRLAQQLATALKAPAYVQAGGPDDLCSFIYVLCLGRQPALIELRLKKRAKQVGQQGVEITAARGDRVRRSVPRRSGDELGVRGEEPLPQ